MGVVISYGMMFQSSRAKSTLVARKLISSSMNEVIQHTSKHRCLAKAEACSRSSRVR